MANDPAEVPATPVVDIVITATGATINGTPVDVDDLPEDQWPQAAVHAAAWTYAAPLARPIRAIARDGATELPLIINPDGTTLELGPAVDVPGQEAPRPEPSSPSVVEPPAEPASPEPPSATTDAAAGQPARTGAGKRAATARPARHRAAAVGGVALLAAALLVAWATFVQPSDSGADAANQDRSTPTETINTVDVEIAEPTTTAPTPTPVRVTGKVTGQAAAVRVQLSAASPIKIRWVLRGRDGAIVDQRTLTLSKKPRSFAVRELTARSYRWTITAARQNHQLARELGGTVNVTEPSAEPEPTYTPPSSPEPSIEAPPTDNNGSNNDGGENGGGNGGGSNGGGIDGGIA